MKIKVRQIMKVKTSSHCETVVTSSFRACSFAMDDGGRCLADVINDPLLLQSFLESGSDDNSKDPQDGTSSESAVESPQVSRSVPATFANHASAEHIIEPEQMGFLCAVDNQGFPVEPRFTSQSGLCSSTGLGGVSLVVASSSVGPQTYQHASSSGATIHHIPSSSTHTLHPHSPASARPATPLSALSKSPAQGPGSVHSMPPPSPLQMTRSPLPSHTPSPAPAWSPAPPVLSPVASRSQSSMPPLTFQQSHNQLIQTSCNVTQFVTAIATSPQTLTQKLAVQQQQQQLFLQQQVSPASQQQSNPRLSASNVVTMVTTTANSVTPPVVQLIPALQSNVSLPTRTSHTNVRPIQPKHPPQILPKPACSTSNQFVSPAPASKQTPPTPVTAGQRTVGVGIQPNATGQLVVGQGQSSMFSGPQGTILLNQIIPGVGQSPILIQGNLNNLTNVQGLQLTLRPPNSASPGQSLNSSNQNNATIIAALQNTSQHTPHLFAPAKSQIHGQQTIVIPSHHGLQSQNINLTSPAVPHSGIMSSSSQGQSFYRSNIILSPRIVGPNQGIQFQQIQTAQGPIFACISSPTIAVPHLPVGPTLQNAAIGNAQLAPVTLPMHGVMTAGQGVISGLSLQSHAAPSALQTPQQSLFGATVPFTSHVEHPSPQLIQVPPLQSSHLPTNHNVNQINNQPQSVEHSPKAPSPAKTSKGPSVGLNLEDILKETGIVPENSPPLSPENSVIEETVPAQLQPSNTVVSSQQLIAASLQGQVLLEQVNQNLQGQNSISQMKLALAQDGSVILQPHNSFAGSSRVQQYIQSPQVQGRTVSTVNSVLIPAVTTAMVSVATSESSIVRSHANLVARLNSPPPVSVPDVSSLGVSSIGVSVTSSLTTITVSTVANTVPLTVQSVNVNSLPIASTGYVMQRTNVPERVFYSEDINNSQNHVVNVSSEISNSTQSIQRANHMNSGFQSFVSSESFRCSMQNSLKTVQSMPISMPIVSTTNCINVVQAEIKTEPNNNVAENKGAAVPTLNLPPYQHVPNQKQQVQKLQKQINELSLLKCRNPEQNKLLQQSHLLLQKLIGSKSGKNARNIQNQIQKNETDIKNIVQRCQAVQNQMNSDQMQSQQVHLKPPVPQQQNHENSKQISSSSTTQNVNLVNLLKQIPSVPATKHSAAPVTTCTITVNNTITTTVASTVTVPTHQKIVNQVVTPVQSRLPNIHLQKPQPESCQQPQQQVIVRLPKPQQPQSNQVQPCPNLVQLKAAPPVKKIVNTVPKTVLINEQLVKDQNGATGPDVNTPFKSKEDACLRLLPYHVYNSKVPSFKEIEKADETFAMVSVSLLERKKRLENKFHILQIKESLRPCSTPDQVMLERLFIKDEEESLKDDKAVVAEGKILSLPPAPSSWLLKELDEAPCDMPPPLTSCQVEEVTVKKEIEDDGHSTEFSDPMHEDSDPVYKDDDNLEAPVIDSCADIVVPQHDENCDRSPPTLKRIVIKPEKHSESDDECLPNKRFKCNNYYEKLEPNRERSNEVVPSKSSVVKEESDRESEVKTNNKYPHVPLTKESYHSENSMDVMVTKIRRELNMSPMEIEDDDLDPVSSHVVDFEPPSGANDLADFDPPVARTEESCDSTLLYNSVRTNCGVKYDFEMLGEWDENYIHHQSNESDVTAGNIMNDHANTSELDLSGLDGLDNLEESEPSIPNGIPELTAETDMNYIGYHIPKHQKRFQDMSVQPSSNCSSSTEQIRAIKSIIGTSADNRSYYGADDMEFLTINNKTSHTHTADYDRSLDTEMGVTSNVSDPVVEAAVRSIQTLR